MFKNKYTKIYLIVFALPLLMQLFVFLVPKVYAVTPKACAFDVDGKYTFMQTAAECEDTLVNFFGESKNRSTAYFLATHTRISNNPCKNDFQIRDISEAEYNSLKQNQPPASGVAGCPGSPTPSLGDVVFPTEEEVDFIDKNKDCNEQDLNESNCNIIKHINTGINLLSALVGIVVTIMIIVGGIQYTAAGSEPNAVAKAKKQIFNAIFALVAYGLTYALLQYLIPGGRF